MVLITNTFVLSFGVALRMILPLFFITIGSVFVWLILGLLTVGMSNYISASATTAFITLYGIRMALELKGDRSLPDLRILATYSVAFGIVLEVLEKIGFFIAGQLAILTTQQRLGTSVSLQSIATAEETLQTAFTFNLISFFALFGFVVFVSIQTVFAVPMAAAARSAGKNSPSSSFLQGFGASFVPLFLVFVTSFFLQFFFKLYVIIIFIFGALIVQLVLLVNVMADYLGSEDNLDLEIFSGFDPIAIVYAIAGVAGLIWLQSLVWSAAALALIKHEGKEKIQHNLEQEAAMSRSTDLRVLRKSRER